MKSLWVGLNLILLMAAMGCVNHAPAINQNVGDQRPKASVPVEIKDVPESAQASSVATDWQASYERAKNPVQDILVPMAARVLDPKRVRAFDSSFSRANQDELIIFNHLILSTSAKDQASPEFLQILKTYKGVLSIDCGKLMDSCKGYLYLKSSSNSAQVTKLIAQKISEDYFQMVLWTIKLKNSLWDNDLIRMLYAQPLTTLSQTELKYKNSVRSLLETALQLGRDKSASPKETRQFLEDIHAWEFVQNGMQNFDASTRESLYSMIAQSKLMYASDGKSIHPGFKKILDAMDADPKGFSARQTKLKEQNAFSPELIGAQYIEHSDEMYFILDSVFTNRISFEAGRALYATSQKTLDDLGTAVENYMRIQFILALYDTTIMAQAIFNADVATTDLLFYAMRQSAGIESIWSTFISQTSPLGAFSEIAAAERPNNAAAIKKLRDLFGSIPRSITMASVYPQELVLFHILSQQNMKLAIDHRSANPAEKNNVEHSLDSGDLFGYLFSSSIPPIFKYSPETAYYNQFQLMYSFDMAIRTNLFTLSKIDIDFFISDTVKRLSAMKENELETDINQIQARFDQAPSFPTFMEACGEVEGKPASRTIYFGDITNSPTYGMLTETIFLGLFSGGSHGTAMPGHLPQYDMGLNYLTGTYSEDVEIARLDLGGYQRLAEHMLNSYKSYLKATKVSDSEIVKKTKLTQDVIDDIKSRREKVLKTGKNWYDTVGKCYWKLDQRDAKDREKTLDMEIAYLHQVHRDIVKLRAGKVTQSDLQEKISFHGMPSNFPGLDRISRDGYLYNKVDTLVRMGQYVMHGFKADDGTVYPPVNPNVTVDYGGRLDSKVEIMRPPQNGGKNRNFVSFTDDEDLFVANGLRVLFDGGNSFVNWMSTPLMHITSWKTNINSMTALYQLEHEVRGTNKDFTAAQILNIQREILEQLKDTPKMRALMKTLQLYTKLDPIFYTNRILVADYGSRHISDKWSLFDFPFMMVHQEQLGYRYDKFETQEAVTAPLHPSIRVGIFEAAQKYYDSRSIGNRGTVILPYNSEFDTYLDNSVFDYVTGQLSAVEDYHNAANLYFNELDKLPDEEKPRADVNLDIVIRTPPYVSQLVLDNYKKQINLMQQNVGHCFVTKETCSDFGYGSRGN